jgi:hypothetical protein
MSKKYVFTPSTQPEVAAAPLTERTPFPDAFSKRSKKVVPVVSEMENLPAFPMNRKKTQIEQGDFNAFNKLNKGNALPDMDAFSMNKKQNHSSADFDAFSKRKKDTTDDFPMSKKPMEGDRPPRPPRPLRPPHASIAAVTAVIVPATLKPGTLASFTATSVIVKTEEAVLDDNSFAAKFAQRMKVMDDPDYVPPTPTITVNVSSEEEFPTLGGTGRTLSSKSNGWGQVAQTTFVNYAEEWHDKIEQEREEKEALRQQEEEIRQQKRPRKKKSAAPVLKRALRVATGTENPEGDFKPIEYDDDAFEDDDEVNQSDLDDEEFFGDEEDDEEDEDELNPNVYEDRRHRDELY